MSPLVVDDLTAIAPAAELRPLGTTSSQGRAPGHGGRRGADPRVAGLLGTAVVTVMLTALGAAVGVSALVLAVGAGALGANLGVVPASWRPGTQVAAKLLLRLGIVLLGLRLALGDVLALGPRGLLVVVGVVTATFVGTRWLGRRLGVSDGVSLLVATGFSICGASAVAAMDGVSDNDEEEVAFAIGLVTLFGTLAMVVLPLLSTLAGLDPASFGRVVGASVHDVAQVIGTAATAGDVALQQAIVVKLTRVAMLAPLVAIVGIGIGRRVHGADGDADGPAAPTTPLLPWFVIGFLVAATVRSTGLLDAALLDGAKTVEGLLLTAAMFGLGVGVDVRRLRRLGGRPVLLASISWLLILAVSTAGFLVLGA